MTTRDDFELTLTAWFEADAHVPAPEHLAPEVIARVARTKRRPGWRIPERWLPMQATARLVPLPRLTPILVVLGLVLAAIAVAIIAGSQHRVPAPFGIAKPGLIAYEQNGLLFVSNPDGSNVRPLSAGSDHNFVHPTWSRDGTRLAFFSVPSGKTAAQLVIAAPDGGERRAVADGLPIDADGVPSVAGPYWAPDGSAIAYAPIRGQVFEIDVVQVAGGAPRTLVPAAPLGANPAWSPDGKTLAFAGGAPQGSDRALYLVAADGSSPPRRLSKVSGGEGTFADIAWSPDGRQLAYRAGSADIRIYLINADGSNERRLTSSKDVEMYPVWSPTGQRIAFGRPTGQDADGLPTFQLVIASPDGGESVTLTQAPLAEYASWSWSPDGTQLLVGTATQGLYLVDPTNTKAPIQGPPSWGDWQRLAP